MPARKRTRRGMKMAIYKLTGHFAETTLASMGKEVEHGADQVVLMDVAETGIGFYADSGQLLGTLDSFDDYAFDHESLKRAERDGDVQELEEGPDEIGGDLADYHADMGV